MDIIDSLHQRILSLEQSAEEQEKFIGVKTFVERSNRQSRSMYIPQDLTMQKFFEQYEDAMAKDYMMRFSFHKKINNVITGSGVREIVNNDTLKILSVNFEIEKDSGNYTLKCKIEGRSIPTRNERHIFNSQQTLIAHLRNLCSLVDETGFRTHEELARQRWRVEL